MLSLSKLELDKVCKDKKDKLVPKGFGLRLHPRPVESPPRPHSPILLRWPPQLASGPPQG